jgi:urease accessory protein
MSETPRSPLAAATSPDLEALLRLLHRASPALPIGAFAYSQGLEPAVAAGWISDEATAQSWMLGVLQHGLRTVDIPALGRLHAAFVAYDNESAARATDVLFASRGSAELQAEDRRLGAALARVLETLALPEATTWVARPRLCHLTLFALATARWHLRLGDAAAAWLFAWCENQAAAAMRLVPLGQTSGLRLLEQARRVIPDVVTEGLALSDEDTGWGCPGVSIASASHETQYSRLFRS